MLKLVTADRSFFQDEPVIRLLDDFKLPGLTKKASTDDRIAEFAKNIKSDINKIYIHILAMGAGEYYGANRNADYFPAEALRRDFSTFVTSPAHIFTHHQNRNPEIALGQVIFAIYNERMARVELIAWVDRIKGKSFVEKIERGEFPATSMATHTPWDECSICGNRAHSRAAYCRHLSMELGRILPDGKKVMAINSASLRFFDLSFVHKPADITSSVLQKLASEDEAQLPTIGSAELAEIEALQEKSASQIKLADLIKQVEGEITGSSDSVQSLLDKVKDPDDEVLDFLVHYNLDHVIHAFAELGISPSISFFAKLIGQKECGSHVPGIEHLVAGLMKADPGEVPVDTDLSSMTKSASVHPRVQISAVLAPFVKQASLYPGFAMERAFDISQYHPDTPMGPMGMIGYAAQGPGLSPDPADSYRKLKASIANDTPGLLKTLIKIAGAAIAAKYLLSKMIEAKMNQVLAEQAQSNANDNHGIKIVLVKSANEAITTQKLVKADLLRNLKI
jgi:hypothetical protein